MTDQTAKNEVVMLKIAEQAFIDEYLDVDIDMRKNKHIGMKVGQLEIELKLSSDATELLIRSRYSGISKLLKDKFETQWHKTSWRAESSSLRFSLRLPDQPVVLKPDVVQKIPQGQVVSAYCTIPLSIELSVDGSKIEEFPIMVLSKTWFGEPDEGLLGYSLKGEVLSSLEKLPKSPIQAVCAIEIENKSLELLCFERLCLRTEYMGLFKSDKESTLSTSKCRLVYAGKERIGKISYLKPSSSLKISCPPRIKQGQNLLFKSFKTV